MATIQKRTTKKGISYHITVCNGYDIAGKQILKKYVYIPEPGMTAKQIEKAVQRVAVEFEQAVINGLVLDGSKITLQEFFYKWRREYAVVRLEATTVEWYTGLF